MVKIARNTCRDTGHATSQALQHGILKLHQTYSCARFDQRAGVVGGCQRAKTFRNRPFQNNARGLPHPWSGTTHAGHACMHAHAMSAHATDGTRTQALAPRGHTPLAQYHARGRRSAPRRRTSRTARSQRAARAQTHSRRRPAHAPTVRRRRAHALTARSRAVAAPAPPCILLPAESRKSSVALRRTESCKGDNYIGTRPSTQCPTT